MHQAALRYVLNTGRTRPDWLHSTQALHCSIFHTDAGKSSAAPAPERLQNPRHEEHKASHSPWAVPGPLPLAEDPNNMGLWRSRFVPLCFDNPEACFKGMTTPEILRSIAVFSACGIQSLVRNADTLYRTSNRVLGKTITGWAIKATFFNHFCAGEDQKGIQPTIQRLHSAGIGAILDYAAESDVHTDDGAASLSTSNYEVIVRTYDYESERACDANVQIFARALSAATTLPGQGFAAIKVTALGDPKLLAKLSRALSEIKVLFQQFDRDGDGYVTRAEFEEVYHDIFTDVHDTAKLESMYARMGVKGQDSVIDYVAFVDYIRVSDLPDLTSKCRTKGALFEATPTGRELGLMESMLNRVRGLCTMAAEGKVRIMIDAEHSYFQPAIDAIAKEMSREFNRDHPVVYNTYQCYLKDSRYKLNADIESSRRQNYKFGAKLVRGAYMVLERANAAALGIPSPIHDDIQDTHQNYNRCVRMLIQEAAANSAEVMIASHNQYSVETAVRMMHEFRLDPATSGVYFGQLLGMADHLSFTLGRHNYKAYKYVPFGPLDEVMPYLIRRAQENSDIMGGVGKEMVMLKAEAKRRVLGIETH